jgi:hypothetical protein
MTDHKQAAAAILTAARHLDDEASLIDAVNIHTRQLGNRDQFERLVDHLAIALAIAVKDMPDDEFDQLDDALRQGNP